MHVHPRPSPHMYVLIHPVSHRSLIGFMNYRMKTININGVGRGPVVGFERTPLLQEIATFYMLIFVKKEISRTLGNTFEYSSNPFI